jgi:adenylate kinase
VRVAVTGTPGTGKTTAVDLLSTDLDIVHLNEVIRSEELTAGRDEARDSLVADLEALADWLGDREDVLFESHLAHHLPADRVVVLRCHPEELARRLAERGEPDAKCQENADSEALDIVLAEAIDRHGEGTVYEIDTTDRSPEAVAGEIAAVIAGEREPSAGTVDFVDYL